METCPCLVCTEVKDLIQLGCVASTASTVSHTLHCTNVASSLMQDETTNSFRSRNAAAKAKPESQSSIRSCKRENKTYPCDSPRSAPLTPRSFRISMDGAIQSHSPESREDESLSPVRPYQRRSVSTHVPSMNDNAAPNMRELFKSQPRAVSSLDLVPTPRRERARRRCSVTKFNLDETTLSNDLDHKSMHTTNTTTRQAEPNKNAELSANSDHPIASRRPRMQRRCSVTKFNLEDSLQAVKREDSLKQLLSKSMMDSVDAKVCFATRPVQARVAWGRAA